MVGFVCEGSTDIVILRRVVESVLGDIDPRPLQPETDALDRQVIGTRAGWSEVRAWCERVSSLDDYFDPDVGDPFDLLVIAIDLDIAIRAGLTKRPSNLEAYDASELCKIVKSWLPAPLPGRVVIAIPVMATEAWILAAMFPAFEISNPLWIQPSCWSRRARSKWEGTDHGSEPRNIVASPIWSRAS